MFSPRPIGLIALDKALLIFRFLVPSDCQGKPLFSRFLSSSVTGNIRRDLRRVTQTLDSTECRENSRPSIEHLTYDMALSPHEIAKLKRA